MELTQRFLVTSALPYANGPLHIGHLAGAYLSADAFVRFQRLMGHDVAFICGADEHGAAITMKASKEGKSPREIIDFYYEQFRETFKQMGVSFDIFHRTSAPLHHETSQEIFRKLYAAGAFEEIESEQYYDEKAGQFLADRYITGTCPKCSHPSAYGDQCENCGSSLSPTDLIDPKSVITGNKPVLKSTLHWYLKLNEHETWLRDWINTGEVEGKSLHYPDDWKNHVIGQCNSWLDGGLQPRSMTRDLDWGIDMPQEIPGSAGKKLYVWLDAPIGYISATKQWAADTGRDWKAYWQDENTKLIHFIGKDNIVFHCLIFPAILKGTGEFILPDNVPANQFMNLEGQKISTSRNWAVWVHEYLEEFPGQQDVLRYYLFKNMPESKDAEFTWSGFQDANNNELVANLANFINRVVVLTNKYYEGIVPEFDMDIELVDPENEYEASYYDSEMVVLFDHLDKISDCIRRYDFRGGLKAIMELSTRGNQLLQANEPWKSIKEDPEAVQVVMNLALQYVGSLAYIIRPYLPFASDQLIRLLGVEPVKEDGELLSLLNRLAEEGEGPLEAGHIIGEPIHLFSKIEDESIQKQLDKLHQSEQSAPAEHVLAHTPIKETIAFEDFAKLDLRVGTIESASAVPKADKLLQLIVDLGFEKRTVLSGIAEQYKPEDLIGKQVTLVANLAPRKMRGIESQGMILMAQDAAGLHLVNPKEQVTPGSTIS